MPRENNLVKNETLRMKEAFELYYSMGENRSRAAVARQMGVSLRTIERWASSFNWTERVRLRDRENAKRLEEKTNKAIVDRKADMLKIVEYAILGQGQFADRLRQGEVRANDIADLEKLVKLSLLLMGEVTERSESHEHRQHEIAQLTTDSNFLTALQEAYERATKEGAPSGSPGPVASGGNGRKLLGETDGDSEGSGEVS